MGRKVNGKQRPSPVRRPCRPLDGSLAFGSRRSHLRCDRRVRPPGWDRATPRCQIRPLARCRKQRARTCQSGTLSTRTEPFGSGTAGVCVCCAASSYRPKKIFPDFFMGSGTIGFKRCAEGTKSRDRAWTALILSRRWWECGDWLEFMLLFAGQLISAESTITSAARPSCHPASAIVMSNAC